MCFIRTYLDTKITLLIFTLLDPSTQPTGHFSIPQLQSSLMLLYCVCVHVCVCECDSIYVIMYDIYPSKFGISHFTS